jgi:hypothetical protein
MNKFRNLIVLILLSLLFVQCDEIPMNNTDDETGEFVLEITDAPVDNSNIKATMVTFTAVELDGERFDFESDITVDIMAYQNGETFTLWNEEIEAKSYSDIKLVLNNTEEANGEKPGCYVERTDGSKDDLNVDGSAETFITVSKTDDPMVEENGTMRTVIDFDLRKSITSEDTDENDFSFSSSLNSSLRLVQKDESASISGKVTDNLGMADDKVVAYAYVKGEYNKSSETSGEEKSYFSNATASASVDASGNYVIPFLEKDEYEVIFVSYEQDSSSGKTEATTILSTSLDLTGSILGIEVDANTTLDISVLAAIPI